MGSEMCIRDRQRSVRDIMWEHCGVVRSEDNLQAGLDKLLQLCDAGKDIDVRPSAEGFGDLALALDLLGSLDSARASILGAIERKESRGSHQRSDFPESSDEQQRNYRISLSSDGDFEMTTHEVDPIPDGLKERFENIEELEVTGRLLE